MAQDLQDLGGQKEVSDDRGISAHKRKRQRAKELLLVGGFKIRLFVKM